MDFWEIFLLIYQLAYLLSLSLVALVKSFLEFLGLITCDNNYLCYTALTALKAHDSCLWYLDSGCSRHMTGNKGLFKTLFEGKIGTVTFWRWKQICDQRHWNCGHSRVAGFLRCLVC